MAEDDKKTEPGWEVVPEAELESAETSEKTEVKEEERKAEETFGKRAEQRIRQLVKKAKAAEERAALAEGRVGQFERDFESLKSEVATLRQGNQSNTKQAVQERYVNARRALVQAKENGDTNAEIAAIEAMTAAQADWRLLGTQPQQAREVEKEKPEPRAGDGLHPKARRWIAAQDWWDEDDVARGAAIAIAGRLEKEGYDPTDDDHYEELEKRLAKRFPEHFKGDEEEIEVERPRQVKQTVAGGSRVSGTAGGRQKVKLTEGQVRMANKLGVPLEVYARNFARMESQRRADGSYGPIEIEIPEGGRWS